MADPECEGETYAQRVEPECAEKLAAYHLDRMLDERLAAMLTPTLRCPWVLVSKRRWHGHPARGRQSRLEAALVHHLMGGVPVC